MSTAETETLHDSDSTRVAKLKFLLGTDEAIDNFDGTPLEQWSKASAARSPSCQDGSTMLGVVVPLKYYMQHVVTINDPAKGAVDVVRTVLIGSTGDMFQFTSDGVYDSLRLMIKYLGEGPWMDGIPITLCKNEKKGRTFMYLEQAAGRIEAPDKSK